MEELRSEKSQYEVTYNQQEHVRQQWIDEKLQKDRLLQIRLDHCVEMLQHPDRNPNAVSLCETLQELQAELETEVNRLNYALKKLKTAEEAYKHAQ